MPKKIRFIHTGDIHLGSPLNCGGEPPEGLASSFKHGGHHALELIFNKAREYAVNFVIIAGDLYDQEARSVAASRFFGEQCRKLQAAGIFVYVISGNHDPHSTGGEPFLLPENVFHFSSEEVDSYDIQDSDGNLRGRILGQSYRSKFESRKMYSYYTVADQEVYNLGILHTQLDPHNPNYVPVSKGELMEKDDIDYWALGHIHRLQIINLLKPTIVYPGTPQGRNVNEEGLKGCLLVEVAGNSTPDICFIPTSPVIYKKLTVAIDDQPQIPRNLTDLENILIRKAELLLKKDPAQLVPETSEKLTVESDFNPDLIEGYIVRWVVQGRGPVHRFIENNREEVTIELLATLNRKFKDRKPFLWSHSILLITGQELPVMEGLLAENKVFKEVNRVVNDILTKKELKSELLDYWGSIWEENPDYENQDSVRFYADQELLAEIIQLARQKIIEELICGGEENCE